MEIKKLLLLATIFLKLDAFVDQINKFDEITLYGDIHLGASDKHTHKTYSNKKLVNIHKKQAINIIDDIKQNESDNIVIVEDMYDYQGDDKDIEKFFNQTCVRDNKKNNCSTCIHFLNNACKNSNIEVINIEYRHNFSFFFYQEEITAQEFLNDLQELIDEIENYDDGEIANDFYTEKLNVFHKKTKKVLKILNKNKDRYFSEIFKSESNLVDNFKLEYHLLFDLKLLHTILQNKDKHVSVCVGRRHVIDMLDILKELGYKHKLEVACHNEPINIQTTLNDVSNFNLALGGV